MQDQRAGFLARAWRGEERLWKVWWYLGGPITIAGAVTEKLAVAINPFLGLALGVALLGAYIAWCVMAWRCAPNVDHKLWDSIARTLILLGLFRTALVISLEISKVFLPNSQSPRETTTAAQPRLNKELYVGEWQNLAEYKSSAFSIYKAGDTYTVETHFADQGVEKLSGTFRGGQLRVSTPSGESSIVYIDGADHLLAFGSEYQRKSKYEKLW